MSAQATGWVWKHSPLRGSKLLVHLAIADVVNDAHDNEFWMHNQNLALKAHVSDGTVDEALAVLKDLGLLVVLTQGGGRSNPTRYQMVMCQTAQILGGSLDEKPPNPRTETAQSAGETAQSAGIAPITNPREPNTTQGAGDDLLFSAEEVPREQPRKISEEQAREILATEFATLWEQYPRKGERSPAFVQYRKRRQDGASAEDLLRAVQGYAQAMAAEGRPVDKIKHGGTFLGPSGVWHDYLDREPEDDGFESNQDHVDRIQAEIDGLT